MLKYFGAQHSHTKARMKRNIHAKVAASFLTVCRAKL